MKTKKMGTRQLVLLAMLSGILLVMSYTPLGYLNIGPLAISLNMIPVAIGAVALGPGGGAFLGAVFGITSCLQCVGIGGTSAMGVILFEISPVLTIVQRLVTRVLAGFLTGVIYRLLEKRPLRISAYLAGFCAALLNTVLFMAALVLLFGNTEYLQELIAGRNVLVFIATFVGINALVEMLAATVVVGAVCTALKKLKLIGGE
ncbi:MAG: ECF transporter S component [Oscillospiraceae bacterium]|nr:ECF transporter S component [Oscillospiraceae bacterium]